MKDTLAMLWLFWGLLTIGSVFIFKADVITGSMLLGFIGNVMLYVGSMNKLSDYFSRSIDVDSQ